MTITFARETYKLPRAAESGVEVFAIGDIHGRADLLGALLEEAVREPRRERRRVAVLLGDLIDRGRENLAAIDLARHAGELIGADETIALMGNHEAMMRLALDPATPPAVALATIGTWACNGGHRVLGELLRTDHLPKGFENLLRETQAALPREIMEWLARLAPNSRSGGVLFVHAGVNPSGRRADRASAAFAPAGVNPRLLLERFLAEPWNIPLKQLDEDHHWAWVRQPFLEHDPGPEGWGGYFIVHGHTPNDGPRRAFHAEQVRRFRLNLDGGSAMTGVAKMAILRGAFVEVVTATAPRQKSE